MANNNVYGVVALSTGVLGSLDYIDGAALQDKDLAIAAVPGAAACFYTLDADLGGSASPPLIISPLTNAGNKRWVSLGGGLGMEYSESSPSGTTILGYNGYFYATRVYNAIYNDYADYQQLRGELIFGKAYAMIGFGKHELCSERCQRGVAGIATDTYGFAIGMQKSNPQVPISVAGWVLAYVNGQPNIGDVLTNDKEGNLVKANWLQKILFPERMIAIYCYKEVFDYWGHVDNLIQVRGRHWVKVR